MSSTSFNPNSAAGEDSGIFGLPFTEAQARLVYLPVPWEATTSYGGGTADGPEAILQASRQVDLYDADVVKPYEAGLFLAEESSEIRKWNEEGKQTARKIIECGGALDPDSPEYPALVSALARVNVLSDLVNERVYQDAKKILDAGKICALIGGDHSTPFGAIRAHAEKFGPFGVLHFDAHSDTRDAYEGFRHSHASIMRNVLDQIPLISKLVQVGIRDFCEEEFSYSQGQGERVKTFYDRDLAGRKFKGENWDAIAKSIVRELPMQVYLSFDIDGLDPSYCPHTGTPVPGGLSIQEAYYIFAEVVRSGRKIIGFDLNEVTPPPQWRDAESALDEWDANVGARLLYKMTAWTLASQGISLVS